MRKRIIRRLSRIDADLSEVIRGSAIAFGIKILAAVLVFSMNVVLSRQLGLDEAGFFFLGYTIVVASAAFGRLGLDNTFVRFIAVYHAKAEWGKIAGLYKIGIHWTLVASTAIAVILFLVAEPLANRIFDMPEFVQVIRVMAGGVPLTAIFMLHASALQGMKKIMQSVILLSLSLPLVILVLVLITQPKQAAAAGALVIGATALTCVLGVHLWRQDSCTRTVAIDIDRRAVLASCLPLLAVVVLSQSVNWSAQIMLGAWASSADVAIFNAAQRTAMLTSFVLVAVNAIAAPKFSAMYKMGQLAALRKTAKNVTRLMLLLAIPLLVVMLALPEPVLMLFGPGYSAGSGALRILAIGQFVNMATGSVSILLSMTGHEGLVRNNVLLAASVTLALGFTLIPNYGVIGAAIATASGVALHNLLCVWQVRRLLGFNTLAI